MWSTLCENLVQVANLAGNPERRKVFLKIHDDIVQSHNYLRKDGARLSICREMFLSTLGLGEWSVHDWVMSSVDGMHSTTKKRQVPATSRQSEALELLESVRKFLKDLPKLPSHYCRASTSEKYLEPQFQSIAAVYRV